MNLKYLFSFILFFSLSHVFYSAEYTWTGANSTFYDVAANWSSSGGGVPTSSSIIVKSAYEAMLKGTPKKVSSLFYSLIH